MSDYCECPADVANTNAPMGGCTVCQKVTKEKATQISQEYHSGEKAMAEHRLSELGFIQANKTVLLRAIQFYISEYEYRFSSIEDFESLVDLIMHVENSITEEDAKVIRETKYLEALKSV